MNAGICGSLSRKVASMPSDTSTAESSKPRSAIKAVNFPVPLARSITLGDGGRARWLIRLSTAGRKWVGRNWS